MPRLTPIDHDPFNIGVSEPQAKLQATNLFGDFAKSFYEGLKNSGAAGIQSYMEAVENQYKPEGAVAVNDAGEWLDAEGNVLNVQRRPNVVPLTKKPQGGVELAMPAMLDVWNTMGGVGGKATLGAGPVLYPALKHAGKVYKAKPGQEHLDALPKELQDTFQKQALSGEDITNFDFGFVNHKGHFLKREDALKYAIDNGLLDPHDAKYGTLTTTMLNDSGAGGKLASQTVAQMRDKPRTFWRGTNDGDTRRISTGNETWDKNLFMSSKKDDALLYGKNLTQYEALPEAKILYEGTKEFVDVAGKWRKNENMLEFASRASEAAKAAGYDAIHFKRQGDIGTAVFNPDKFKILNDSGGGQKLASQAAAQSREMKAPTFYSAAEKAVEGIKQNKASGDQWLGTLSNQKGVKPEELEWTGLQEFLKGKENVTKKEIQDYLKDNKVELKEIWKNSKLEKNYTWERDNETGLFNILDEDGKIIDSGYHNARAAEREILNLNGFDQSIDAGAELNRGTKYSKWQLPGGENYRELLLTLPPSGQSFEKWVKTKYGKDLNEYNDVTQKTLKNQYEGESSGGNNVYKSSHWDEPNILAHMRMNDRTIDGKKSLHLEEIQSDWHQQGREKGYKVSGIDKEYDSYIKDLRERAKAYWYAEAEKLNLPKDKADQIRAKTLPDDLPIHQVAKYLDEEAKLNEMWKKKKDNDEKGVPNAPFKKTWHELALKRAIREAAEKGYERLSWTPGEAQAARYDLSKHVKLLSVSKDGDKYLTYIEGKDGQPLISGRDGWSDHGQKSMTAEELENTVGKEIAKKAIEGKPNKEGWVDIRDNNLKIGGEGMKGFYDQIIPKSIEKIGKEFGVKVKKGFIKGDHDASLNEPFESKAKAEDILKRGGEIYAVDRYGQENQIKSIKGLEELEEELGPISHYFLGDKQPEQPIFYIDIPKNMRQSIVGKGQPLFSGTPILTPVNYQPEFEE